MSDKPPFKKEFVPISDRENKIIASQDKWDNWSAALYLCNTSTRLLVDEFCLYDFSVMHDDDFQACDVITDLSRFMPQDRATLLCNLYNDFKSRVGRLPSNQGIFNYVDIVIEKNLHQILPEIINTDLIHLVKRRYKKLADYPVNEWKNKEYFIFPSLHQEAVEKKSLDNNTIDGVKLSDFPEELQCAIKVYIECWHDLPTKMRYPKKDPDIKEFIKREYQNLAGSSFDRIYTISKKIAHGETARNRSSNNYKEFIPHSKRIKTNE